MRQAGRAGQAQGRQSGQQAGAAAQCPPLWGHQLAEALHRPALKHLLALHPPNQCASLSDFDFTYCTGYAPYGRQCHVAAPTSFQGLM